MSFETVDYEKLGQFYLGKEYDLAEKGSSAVTKATTAYKQHQDVANAEAKIEGIQEEIALIQKELEDGLAELTQSYDPSVLVLEQETLKPTRSDVQVERVGLLWM